MQEVEITFANIQSHELTRFTLKPGMNFILAEDNNVGKSTIFKLLSTMAAYPQVPANKVDSLIRIGCDKAYAGFAFGDAKVVCWLSRGKTSGAAKMFFEHIDGNGQTTRSSMCPKDLISALGIVVNADFEVMNFNDADSVQLVAKPTVEGDAIITHVMTDERVNNIKRNMVTLARDIQVTEREVNGKLETAERILKRMHYTPGVEEFNEALPWLSAATFTLDYCLVPVDNVELPCDSGELKLLEEQLQLCEALSSFDSETKYVAVPSDVECKVELFSKLQQIDFGTLCQQSMDSELVKSVEKLYQLLRKFSGVYTSISELEGLTARKVYLQRELAEYKRELSDIGRMVDCPIKGRVYYSDEKCIPADS